MNIIGLLDFIFFEKRMEGIFRIGKWFVGWCGVWWFGFCFFILLGFEYYFGIVYCLEGCFFFRVVVLLGFWLMVLEIFKRIEFEKLFNI